ncbi:MAG TPA: alcohol dehydrogenase catalytic domain-containing protein [Bryobacteraceae bacterium]|nr:alcohol dehydrogenase catalytic domain-containing protein [Bryobacteraceae bacterium]
MPIAPSSEPAVNLAPDLESPSSMRAAVYKGAGLVEVDSVPVPEIGPGEILIRVETCGICHTDLKKIAYDLLAPPRIYGHETAGVVAAVGAGVTRYRPGDRVIVFHHIPCGQCFYCQRKLYAQCPVYKKVGVTAGYEPAGGGFSQYVRAMDWIVERGVEKIPEGVSFDQACFVEPVNTCIKGVKQIDPQPEDVVVILGQGPIGLIFTMIAARTGARILATDAMPARRALAAKFGALEAYDPLDAQLDKTVRTLTGGRGADVVIVAASARGIVEQAVRCSRPGARILLFAQTSHQERVEVSGAAICMEERTLCGSYSASVDLQAESAGLVFSGALPVENLISHRYPLGEIHRGIERALHPDEVSLKIVVHPQR